MPNIDEAKTHVITFAVDYARNVSDRQVTEPEVVAILRAASALTSVPPPAGTSDEVADSLRAAADELDASWTAGTVDTGARHVQRQLQQRRRCAPARA